MKKISKESQEMAKEIEAFIKNPSREVIESMDKRIKELRAERSYICNNSCGCCLWHKRMG